MKATKRLPSNQRLEHLLVQARELVREEGAEALTLISLAKRAGVTKPITYRHFQNRDGLLTALFKEFDDRQNAEMEKALEASGGTLSDTADVVATSYIDCTLNAGTEIGWLIPALQTSPLLSTVFRSCRERHIERLSQLLSRFKTSAPDRASLSAIIGAADALAEDAAREKLDRHEAIKGLSRIIQLLADEHH